MAKARGVEAKLKRLHELRREEASPAAREELGKARGDKSNLVVAAAAEIVGEWQVGELAPALEAVFERLMEPEANDNLCRAKTAIVEALNKLDYQREEIYRRGVRHVQKEAVWGGTQDMAAQLRGNSAFGLVRLRCRDVLILLADLLADPEEVARRAAAQALGGLSTAIPLLRFKARIGDSDPTVTAECLTALMDLEPVESIPFVRSFLGVPDAAVQEGAVMALATSRRPEVLPILADFWQQTKRVALREVVLLGIAMLRLPAAVDFLLTVVVGENRTEALAALEALRIHRHSEVIKQRVAEVVDQKRDPALQKYFAEKFTAE